MIRKRLLTLSGLMLLAAIPAAPAYARPAPYNLSPNQRPQIDINELCAQSGSGYCLNDWNAAGSGGAVKMENSGYGNDNFDLYGLGKYCYLGSVTNGMQIGEKACPFPVGSGLNSIYNTDGIYEIKSLVSGTCVGTDIYENADLGPCPPPGGGGSGSNIWIQGPSCGPNSYYYINLYWSAQHGNSHASSLISGGAIGAQAYVVSDNPATSCWEWQTVSEQG